MPLSQSGQILDNSTQDFDQSRGRFGKPGIVLVHQNLGQSTVKKGNRLGLQGDLGGRQR